MNNIIANTQLQRNWSEVTKYWIAGNSDPMNSIALAKSHGCNEVVIDTLKALADILDTTQGRPLLRNFGLGFTEMLRPVTLIGDRLGLQPEPLLVRVVSQTQGVATNWVGEKNPTPVSRAAFDGGYMSPTKISGMVVFSQELARSSSPSAQIIISRDLVRAVRTTMDRDFMDPQNAGIVDVKPASITYGAPQFPSSGDTVSNIDQDLALLINSLSDAGSDLASIVFVMHPRTAIYLSRLRGNTDDAPAYPQITASGGYLLGIKVVTSGSIPMTVTTGSPQTSISLLDTSQIAIGDDGETSIHVSGEAAIQMETEPNSGATQQVSLWQLNLIACAIFRLVNWRRRHPGMVATLTGVTY